MSRNPTAASGTNRRDHSGAAQNAVRCQAANPPRANDSSDHAALAAGHGSTANGANTATACGAKKNPQFSASRSSPGYWPRTSSRRASWS